MQDVAARPPARSLVGLGLRWEFLDEVVDGPDLPLDFFEVAPENSMRRGGYSAASLARVRSRYPIFAHGLTLSTAGSDEPEAEHVGELSDELARLDAVLYSEHLAVTRSGPLYFHELLPPSFTRDCARRAAHRLDALAAALGRPVAVENITYYARLGRTELDEADFLQALLEESRAGLLLDVNNLAVNAENHGFDAAALLARLPLERVVEIHVAGHTTRASGLVIDDHGAPVETPVLRLLALALARTGPVPVLLERDRNVPPLAQLLPEIAAIRRVTEHGAVVRTTPEEERHAASA